MPAAGVGAEAYEERAEADEEGPRRLGRIAARALCVPQQAIPPPPSAASCFALTHLCVPQQASSMRTHMQSYIC